ncbi:MAG: hypothetical protein IJL30_00440 [Clostridia bacterium]|nr:hypothetical protein [Clostridia bacterium]
MRNIAKITVLLIMLSVIATSCAPSSEQIFDVEFEQTSDGLDLGGVEIVYEVGLDPSIYDSPTCLGYELDTHFGDLASARLKNVQVNLNCKVKVNYTNNYTSCRNFVACSASGTFLCDVISGISDMWRGPAMTGMLVGLSEIENYIDFRNEEKWGNRNMLEVIYYETDLFGVVPMLWPEVSVSYSGITVVNEDIIATIGATDPRDLLENGEWTWTTFRDCLEKYYLSEGNDVKHYALTCSTHSLGAMYLLSNGFRMSEIQPNGQITPGLMTNGALVAMEEALDIYNGPLGYTLDTMGNAVERLIAGTTVLGCVNSDSVIGMNGKIAKEMSNFGLVSWPTGPGVEPGYASGFHANIDRCIVFSRASHYPESTAAVISAIYEPFEEYPTFNDIIELMSRNYFFDPRDSKVYYDMYLNSQFAYFFTAAGPLYNSMGEWVLGRKSPAEYVESIESQLKERMEDCITPAYNGIKAVWGE